MSRKGNESEFLEHIFGRGENHQKKQQVGWQTRDHLQEKPAFLCAYATVTGNRFGVSVDHWVLELEDEFSAVTGSGVRLCLAIRLPVKWG